MMRPQRVGDGADHELIAGLLGAAVVLDSLRDLLAWIADDTGSGEPPAASSELADALLGAAAILAAIDRWAGWAREAPDDAPLPAAPRVIEDLLR